MDFWTSATIIATLPIAGGFACAFIAIFRSWSLKSRELRVQEQRLKIEAANRTDALNAQILRMDDFGLSPVEISSMAEDLRQLRQEVAQLRQEMNNRTLG